jgi:hypothetical protein
LMDALRALIEDPELTEIRKTDGQEERCLTELAREALVTELQKKVWVMRTCPRVHMQAGADRAGGALDLPELTLLISEMRVTRGLVSGTDTKPRAFLSYLVSHAARDLDELLVLGRRGFRDCLLGSLDGLAALCTHRRTVWSSGGKIRLVDELEAAYDMLPAAMQSRPGLTALVSRAVYAGLVDGLREDQYAYTEQQTASAGAITVRGMPIIRCAGLPDPPKDPGGTATLAVLLDPAGFVWGIGPDIRLDGSWAGVERGRVVLELALGLVRLPGHAACAVVQFRE